MRSRLKKACNALETLVYWIKDYPKLSIVILILAVIAILSLSSIVKTVRYNAAVDLYNKGEYIEAEKKFSLLQGYKDADKYLEKTLFERKYALLNVDSGRNELLGDSLLTDKNAIESAMTSNFYGRKTWYDSESGQVLPLDKYYLNGKAYGVKYAVYFDGYLSVKCYYIDTPKLEFSISDEYVFFDYIEEVVYYLDITEGNRTKTYYEVTPQKYNELVSQNIEAMERMPNYDDATIIEKTFNAFKNKIRSNYSGADVIYHYAEYSDAYVVYDAATKTYTCTMTGQYTTNMFDFWGTSTQTYYITAQFRDTGSELVLIGYSH